MKFCKNLQRVVDISDPEWAPYWTNYKMLKKLIKELPSLVPADEAGGKETTDAVLSPPANEEPIDSSLESSSASTVPSLQQQQHHGDQTTEQKVAATTPTLGTESLSESQKDELGKSPGEIAFFKLLHAEFKKVTHFFDKAQQEFSIREERVREGMELMKKPNSIMVTEKWSTLAKSIYRLYKDLSLLETFAIMTYCSFSKILKKHDKVTGHQTRAAFMSNVVNKSNFASYPRVSAMITRCEKMYEDVSRQLEQEGKEGLYEDERLFINMINRLNEQALEIEDAPDQGARRLKPGKISRPSLNQPESRAISTLRLLVEENESRKIVNDWNAGDCDSEGATKKRNGEQPPSSLPDAKRPKWDAS